MMQWQMYWPSWWKLWPHYTYKDDYYNDIPIRSYWFAFGPYQVNWVRHYAPRP